MTPATVVTPEDVRAAIDRVPDPEMPPVSVGDLGMVVDVRVQPPHDSGGARVAVDLVPTFSGCPATALIRRDVAEAVAAIEGVEAVEVRFVDHVTWTPARISEAGRARLRDFGIAPPGGRAGGGGGRVLHAIGGVTCPLCGSADTVVDSPFGPTPCRAVSYCNACRNPFEAIKD